MSLEEESPRAHASKSVQPLRALLHWLIKPVVVLFLGIRYALRPRLVRYGLVAVAMLGIVGWNFAGSSLQSASVAGIRSAEPISAPAAGQLPRAPIVEQYLRAQASFNASGMWDSISEDLRAQMEAQNATPQSLQSALDSARQQGRRYLSATYIGGVPVDDGQSAYFYVVQVETPAGATKVPYIYVVGPDGKISSIQ